jgi:hypothetical protein
MKISNNISSAKWRDTAIGRVVACPEHLRIVQSDVGVVVWENGAAEEMPGGAEGSYRRERTNSRGGVPWRCHSPAGMSPIENRHYA